MRAGELTAAHLGRWIGHGELAGQVSLVMHDETGTFVQLTPTGHLALPHSEPVQLLTLTHGNLEPADMIENH